jgi:hypothetical protein
MIDLIRIFTERAPQGGIQAQPPTRLRAILIFMAMPVIGFLIVTLIR